MLEEIITSTIGSTDGINFLLSKTIKVYKMTTIDKARFSNIRVLMNSYEKRDNVASVFGIGLSTHSDEPIPAFYGVTEERYELGNSNKIGLSSMLPHIIHDDSFYTMDLNNILPREQEKNPNIGYYEAKSVPAAEINVGDLVCFPLMFKDKKIGEMVYKITEKGNDIEFIPLVGNNLNETFLLSVADFEEFKKEDNTFIVYSKLSDKWLKDTLADLKGY